MKLQYRRETCERLSNLHFAWGCIPFDKMPFATSLIKHNPRIYDLFECINSSGRDHEFLARIIKINTEQRGVLFTPISELSRFEDTEGLQRKYNLLIYLKHTGRFMRVYKDHFYIKEYADDTNEIIKKLKELSLNGISGYTNFVESWLSKNTFYNIDSPEKLIALKTMFSDSQVALIYGSAGTGKSTLINHISNLYNDREKLYLANTNPAVDNLRRRVNADNRGFMTIRKFLSNNNQNTEYDILFIDECSTVSNKDMKKILEKATYKLLVLVGDVFQIESILFGNWFNIARTFISPKSVFELVKPYRSTNEELLTVWDRVRKLDDAILEPMVKNKYSAELNESIFEHSTNEYSGLNWST